MADGTHKPISQMDIGDKVLATDPEHGITASEAVTALHKNVDTDLLDMVVIDAHGHTATLNTTQNHPFWDLTTHQWTQAGRLRLGDKLQTATGAPALVAALRPHAHTQLMWNLTVKRIHTYYVLAGNTPVLVHNACGPIFSGDGFQHVLYEHVRGSPGVTPGNTLFSKYLDVDDIGDLIEDASKVRGRPNTGVNPRTGLPRDGTIHTKKFDYPIGDNDEKSLEVILNPNGSVRTAYPVG